jgi:hypothetical protein
MAELRRQEDELYMDRAGTQNAREDVFYNNDDVATQSANKPRLVNTDTHVGAGFDDRTIQASPSAPGQQLTPTPLFSTTDVGDLRTRWGSVQAGFVDEPRWAVQEADKLVAAAMDRLSAGFAEERSTLEKQWDRGEDVSTEELRLALQRYRTFFDRLLNV